MTANDRDPVRAAMAALRNAAPEPSLGARIKDATRVASQSRSRSLRARFALAAGSIAAVLIVGLAVPVLLQEPPVAQPPDRSPEASAPESSFHPASHPPVGVGPDTVLRAIKDFGLSPDDGSSRPVEVAVGQRLLVVAGPTDHNGKPSYLLQHFGDLTRGYRPGGVTAWMTSEDVSERLVIQELNCPADNDLRSVAALQPFAQMRCFGWPRELSFEPVTARQRAYGSGVSNTWISDDGQPDFFTGLPVYGLTPALALPESGWFRVTGHFDDPGATECGDPAKVASCRERFIVTAVSAVAPPDTVLTGSWRTTARAPIDGRTGHAMAWTGSEVVVWGGFSSSAEPGHSVFDAVAPRGGAAYDPVTDRWRLVADAPIPGRESPIMAWSGTEILVFGGRIGEATRLDGAAWDPGTNRWRAIARSPLSGVDPIGGWVKGRLYVATSTGAAAYDPVADRWTKLPAAPIRPGWRSAAVAADRLFVIAFGDGATPPVEWAVLDPTTGTWRHGVAPIEPLQAGIGFSGGNLVIATDAGATFDPVTEVWGTGAKCEGAGSGAVWTGSVVLGTAAAWDTRIERCLQLPPAPPRDPPFDDTNGREFAVGVWTGKEYVTWSGGTGGDIVWVPKDGAIFTPEHDLGPCCG